MRLAFLDIAAAYTAQTPTQQALGGTQSAVAYLSVELARKNPAVFLITRHERPHEYANVKNIPPAQLDDDAFLTSLDALIVNGRWSNKMLGLLKKRAPKLPVIAWMHEACFQTPLIEPSPDIAAYVFVSHWQKNLNAPLVGHAQSIVIPNGIAPAFMMLKTDKSGPPTAVYSGSAKRGLMDLPHILPALHAALPDLRFEIFGERMLDGTDEQNAAFKAQLAALPGVTWVGQISQNELAQRFSRAHFFLSPNAYPETFCIALAESMAAGLHPIITTRAAMPETAAGFATLVNIDDKDSPSWNPESLNRQRFIEAAIAAIRRPLANHDAQIAYARTHFDWARHAGAWLQMIGDLKK